MTDKPPSIAICQSCYGAHLKSVHKCPYCGEGMTGDELKTERERLGMTQEEFAKALGYSGARAVRWWESGKVKVPRHIPLALGQLRLVAKSRPSPAPAERK